ncbi:hypothetical protein KUTeg_018676 [Tegillarca granosa]|uniref:Uncharacterized protein n=1 Tax=Tegillarca granosa TaxID=220873 RepID=A0ABQ9EEM6_TEGGR|nr:hypothetical protein KUTeg_018676 [Tegillarca granosa]
MPLIDPILLTIMKLRRNFDNIHLANVLISPQYVFTQIWPHRNVFIEHRPPKFKCDFLNTIIILDETKCLDQLYWDYKSARSLDHLEVLLV